MRGARKASEWSAKGVGGGVYELNMDFGPEYRIYFGKDGGRPVILLGESAKKRQGADVGSGERVWAGH